ncbi:Eclosion hormone [Cinara cedri]|uniref:Eclosion hormone n=1 Tax=Cinara cedri TaxID=506608 RepID=A0A5E4NQN8_9HEMI|nr:Eclosion hormone [Cinara cedri]
MAMAVRAEFVELLDYWYKTTRTQNHYHQCIVPSSTDLRLRFLLKPLRQPNKISKTKKIPAKMSGTTLNPKKTLAAVLVLMVIGHAVADMADVGMCIRNCAQCKKMLGAYFEGPLCADACVKFKGKMIPDCENIDSVAPFLSKLE